MKLALITDEVSQDPEEAARFAVEHGVRYVAVRSAWNRNILQLRDDEVERLAMVLHEHRLQVSAVLSPLFKCHDRGSTRSGPIDPHFAGFPPVLEAHLKHGRRLPAIAVRLGAGIVRIFTFLRGGSAAEPPPTHSPIAWETLRGWPAGMAAVENEHSCRVRTLPQLEQFCSEAGLPAVVDPCNQYIATGDDGLHALTSRLVDRMVDLHVKDRLDNSYVPVGQGRLRWPRLLERLDGLGYAGLVTLESHLRGDRQGVAMSLAALRRWIDERARTA